MTYFMSHFATIMTCDDDFLAKFWIIIGWSWKFKLWMSIVAIFATWAKSSQIIYTKDSSAIDLSEIDDITLRPKSRGPQLISFRWTATLTAYKTNPNLKV